MDRVLILLVVSMATKTGRAAIKCHDCSSWNPYCKEKVDAPFKNAVATIECEKTSTCFLKKDESGVINRGCADWWMESQVDIEYTGCQTQHVPWLGEMTWCFCKKDYCNGGSIDMLSKGILPEIKEFPKDEWGDYSDGEWGSKSQGSEDSGKDESEEEGSESEKSKEEKQGGKTGDKEEESGKGESGKSGKESKREEKSSEAESGGKEDEGDDGKGDEGEENKADEGTKWSDWGKSNWKTFDDTNPGYAGGMGKTGDPKYRVWFWHADSDRPDYERDENLWRAPDSVEAEDGRGWDFPVTGELHSHTATEASDELDISTGSSTRKDVRFSTGSSTSKDVRTSTGSSTNKWTSTSTYPSTSTSTRGGTAGTSHRSSSRDSTTETRGSQGDDLTTSAWKWGLGWAHIKPWWLKDANDKKPTVKPRRWTPHPTTRPVFDDQGTPRLSSKWVRGGRMVEVAEDGGNIVNAGTAEENREHTEDNSDATEDISIQEFFCWDCYSDSPLCGEKVDTVKAAYLGKSACSETNKCFVRNDGGVIYRGCADGWMNSVINTGYVGCKVQHMWGRTVEWCFCTASLCNGDSMQTIHDKYLARMEPFKDTLTFAGTSSPAVLPQSVMAAREKPASLSKNSQTRLSPFNHLAQKTTRHTRSTERRETTVSFRAEEETEFSRVTSNLSTTADSSNSSISNNSSSTVSARENWVATSTGNSSTEIMMGNGTLDDGFEKKEDLKALL